MITASICTIGDEILIGQIIDTNSAKIAIKLNQIGVKVVQMVSISDNSDEIINSIRKCLNKSNIVIITGGLGPTKDDITKKCLAQLTNSTKFIQNTQQLAVIKEILSARGIELNDLNIEQSLVPDTCKVIVNKRGTAPAMQFNIITNDSVNNTLFSLPGVPFEMEGLMPSVIDAIKSKYPLKSITHKTIYTFGIPESTLAKKIENWEDALPDNIKLAYLPNPILGVRLRLSIFGSDSNSLPQIQEQVDKLKVLLGDAIYGQDDCSLQQAIGELLIEKRATVSVAESCTGGLISQLITSISGASQYYNGSITSYHNSVKIDTLGVNPKTIETYGAVSEECVKEMSQGVKRALNTTYSIATSGIAGPNGGTPQKPVGLVWVAVSGPKGTKAISYNFKGTRATNIDRFASNALNLFRLSLLNGEI